MAKLWVLDKIIKQGTTYQTPKRVAYVIKKLGTDSSGLGRLKIEEVELGYIDTDVAPLRVTGSNLNGPLDLEDNVYVIPPEVKFSWEGDSGSIARIIGDIIMLDVGEGLEAGLLTRYKTQGRKYKNTYKGTFSLATDEAWKADAEYEVFSLTPLTTEKVRFDDIVMISITGDTVNAGDFGVEFYMNNVPLELDVASNAMRGIDSLAMPLPPDTTKGMVAFTLRDFPIEVPGDQTLSIRVRNTSGSDKSPASGSAWSVTLKIVGKYERAE